MLLIQQKRQRLKRANGFEIIEVITGGSDQSWFTEVEDTMVIGGRLKGKGRIQSRKNSRRNEHLIVNAYMLKAAYNFIKEMEYVMRILSVMYFSEMR